MEKRFRPEVLIAANLLIAGVMQAATAQPEESRLRGRWLGEIGLAM